MYCGTGIIVRKRGSTFYISERGLDPTPFYTRHDAKRSLTYLFRWVIQNWG